MGWYAVSLLILLRLDRVDWPAGSLLVRIARWCWSFGAIFFVIHVVMAFQFYHRWSHTDAFQRTRDVGGVGEGIYLSYLFTALWIADVLWWWARPEQYATRNSWIGIGLHSFMVFMVFNSVIVFESGPTRWIGALMFAVISLMAFQKLRRMHGVALHAQS